METLIERLKESEKEGLLPPQQPMPMSIHNPMVPPAHSAMFPSMVRHFVREVPSEIYNLNEKRIRRRIDDIADADMTSNAFEEQILGEIC